MADLVGGASGSPSGSGATGPLATGCQQPHGAGVREWFARPTDGRPQRRLQVDKVAREQEGEVGE